MKKSICILVLAIIFTFGSMGIAFAETTQTGEDPQPAAPNLISFQPLDSSVAVQKVYVGTPLSKLNLPTTLNGVDESGNVVVVTGVTWTPNETFSTTAVGSYIFTADIPESELYTITETAVPPTIGVTTVKQETIVYGLDTDRHITAGNQNGDNISFNSILNREVYVQMYNTTTKKWATKKTYSISKNAAVIYYPKEYYSKYTTYFRLYIPSNDLYEVYTSPTIKINVKKAYQNPSGWYHIYNSTIQLESTAGYNLRIGYMGLKVSMVQKKFAMGNIPAIYGSSTKYKVIKYQKAHGLKATGVVDYKTWQKMGFSDYSWYYKGAYVSPIKVNLASTRSQHVEALIANAYRYVGTKYIVGASGKPGTGVDCSGLVMQSMYAAGINPKPVSVIRHSHPGYEYESRNLWKDSRLKSVSYDNKKRGDLVFYHSGNGTVTHVAIYLGNGKIIESNLGHLVRVKSIHSSYYTIKGIKRIFK